MLCGWNIKTDRCRMRQSVDTDNPKMRVLIITALLACASAAPSVLNYIPYTPFPLSPAVSPYAALSVAPVGVAPVVVPQVPAGDIQAAAIDAQVKIADQAQALADQAREVQDKAAENINEGVAEANDIGKEKSEEAFWAAEEKKYQELNEAQIAEAKATAAAAAAAAAATADVAASEAATANNDAEPTEDLGIQKSETIGDIFEEDMELKAEEKPMEAEMKDEKTDDTVEIKAAAPEMPKAEDFGAYVQKQTVEIKAAAPEMPKGEDFAYIQKVIQTPYAFGPGFNFQPYVAPISYQAPIRSFPIATIPQLYQPAAIAVKHAW